MARVHVPITVLNAAGEPVSGASVTIRKRSDNSLVNVYATETGGTAGANPASTDTTGRVDRWIDRQAVKMTVTATGLTTYDEYWDAVPAGDGTIDSVYLANDSVNASKILDGTIGVAEHANLVVTSTDPTVRSVGAAPPAIVGTDVSVQVTAGAHGLVAIMVQFEAVSVNGTSHAWGQLTRNGSVFLPVSRDWLINGTDAYTLHGTVVVVTNPGANPDPLTSPLLRFPLIDHAGPGTHTYKLLIGGTGSGGSFRNRTLWAWPVT